MLFLCALSVGASAPNPDTRNFSEKSFLELQKLSLKLSGVFGAKVLRIFKELFQKFLEARFGTQFQHITKK